MLSCRSDWFWGSVGSAVNVNKPRLSEVMRKGFVLFLRNIFFQVTATLLESHLLHFARLENEGA